MNNKRLRILSDHKHKEGPVAYWMNRDCRAEDNWALLYALEKANEYKQPLLVVYNLQVGFLGGGYRQHVFKIEGLRELSRAFEQKKISFFLVVGNVEELLSWFNEHQVSLIVTDFSPLREQISWLDKIVKKVSCPVHQVDAHNIIPVWETSNKQEYAARTIRPKIYRNAQIFTEEFPKITTPKEKFSGRLPEIDWDKIANTFPDKSVLPISWLNPGAKAAHKRLAFFLERQLGDYESDRNNALKRGQSDLSPYLHYGQIAPQRIALEVVKETGRNLGEILQKNHNGSATGNSAAAFLEELFVRRELADNFCYYNRDYDSFEGFPDWAKNTLDKHRKDRRDYIYSLDKFEQAKTHDSLWNTAQLELVEMGKMNGYMRMYWAKKILEWTKSPEEAMKFAIYLNDKYSLDGRDPNGYVGIAWSIGGVHDRPWFERPIFGTVRYMAESGVKKRFNLKDYIKG